MAILMALRALRVRLGGLDYVGHADQREMRRLIRLAQLRNNYRPCGFDRK